jgi:hypothetical protein
VDVGGALEAVSMSAPPWPPDAELAEVQLAGQLLELAEGHVRAALEVPGKLDAIRQVVGELTFENAALRDQLKQLASRVAALEKRAGVGR